MADPGRSTVARLFRYFVIVFALALVYILLDYSIDIRPPTVQASYRFSVPALEFDKPEILRRDNLSLIVIRRSPRTQAALDQAATGLQDAASARSRQPAYARNPLRSREPEYFVAYALGTDLGCPLVTDSRRLRESCSGARYDFAGRALAGAREFSNLAIPDYTLDLDLSYLTVKP